MFETHRLHCWVGEKELQWENKTVSKEGLIKQLNDLKQAVRDFNPEIADKIKVEN